jgi:hypothetical protein
MEKIWLTVSSLGDVLYRFLNSKQLVISANLWR